MRSIGKCVGASITEKKETGKKKLHVYIEKDFEYTIKNKGLECIELIVFENDIPQYETQCFDLVGKKVSATWDYTQYGKKLYNLDEVK